MDTLQNRSLNSSAERWRESLFVVTMLSIVGGILWWRFLPLPHQDLNFYTEPAYMLAQFGRLSGFGSQYVDLTYQKGMYFYPPGYSLLLGAWIKAFGISADSLLGYTHLVHTVLLFLLWSLLRNRYGCSKLISALVVLSVFFRMPHGRPDLTGCMLSLAAWAALPSDNSRIRLILSGCLAAMTGLVSPTYGAATFATLVVLILTDLRYPRRPRGERLAVWLFACVACFAAILSVVLQSQHAWTMAYLQFKTNAAIRGRELNTMPNLKMIFTLVFSIIPFILLAVLPAMVTFFAKLRERANKVWTTSAAFLAASLLWLGLNKSQLLLDHHYLFPAKSIFMGVFWSRPAFPKWLQAGPLLLLSLISCYYYKADFLYLATPLRASVKENRTHVRPLPLAAIDSLYFSYFFKPQETLNYETVGMGYWPRYLAAIPAAKQSEMLRGLPRTPAAASMLLFSAITVHRFPDNENSGFECVQSEEASNRLRALGHTWNLPAAPFALTICIPAAPKSALPDPQ